MNVKRKGNNFEIAICKQISRFLTNNERDDLLWRIILSGGLQTIRDSGMERHAGDIVSNHPLGELIMSKIIFECKHYKNIDIWSLLTHPNSTGQNIMGWWNIHLKKAQEVNRHPVLIARQNNKPILFLCHFELGQMICSVFDISPVILISSNCYCFFLDTILSTDSEKFKKILEELKEWQDTQT
jgi:hypothetical protein